MANGVTLTTLRQVEQVVGQIAEKCGGPAGIKTVYCVACGGSLSGAYPLFYLLKTEAKTLHSDCITAGEFVSGTPKRVDESAVVFLMSRGGNTPETVAAAKHAKALGAAVITISISGEDELSQCGDYHFIWAASHAEDSYIYSSSAIALALGFELLRVCEGYANYAEAQKALEQIDGIVRKAILDATPKAEKYAEVHQDDPVIYTLGSGPVYNIAYSTCICHLMEMEWIHSSAFHTGEFFHGPFEITDKEVPLMVFMSSGKTRALDERARSFVERYSEQVEVLDAAAYGADALGEGVREYFDNIILAAVGRVYTETLAKYKQHPFLYRKYMFKVEY